jgi:hypothetical protein
MFVQQVTKLLNFSFVQIWSYFKLKTDVSGVVVSATNLALQLELVGLLGDRRYQCRPP